MDTSAATIDELVKVLATTLGIDAGRLNASTPLFGSLPELDSMAVVELVVAIEERFGVSFDEDEVTAEVFETVGSLAALVESKRNG
ncbi:MAG TPA: acyl carrier protein [Natronosporangium sp.]